MAIRNCSICSDSGKREFVNRLLAQGISYVEISRRTRTLAWREKGFAHPIDRLTVTKHARTCLTGSVTADIPPHERKSLAIRAAHVSSGKLTKAKRDDVPGLVHDMVVTQLKAGELKVTTRDGLEAAKILDRRVERQRDRDAGVEIARLLAQIVPPAAVLRDVTPTVIEGVAVEVKG